MTSTLARMDSLPDEVVRDILSEILVVPDVEFSKVGALSNFGRNPVSSSHMLLVNRQWLRAGTPLLYECVVLRNTPQARALYDALKGKAGPQLKRCVRRMRLEGSFGTVIDKIFNILPGITDLFLKLPKHSDENVNGLIQGLPKLSPTRLIFEFTGASVWNNSFLVADALCKALRKWKNLVTLRFHVYPFHRKGLGSRDDEFTRLLRLGEAISDVPHLRIARISFSEQRKDLKTARLATEFTKAVVKSRSLRVIQLLFEEQSSLDEMLERAAGKPWAKDVRFSLSSSCAERQDVVINLDRMACIPPLPGDIVRIIIDMDLRACLCPMIVETGYNNATAYQERCLDWFRVSKAIYEIALPLSFRFIFITSAESLAHVVSSLYRNDVLRHYVEAVVFYDFEDDDGVSDETTARRMMKLAPNIQQISIRSQYASVLDELNDESKWRIRKLNLCLDSRVDRRIVSQFNNLSHLVLSSSPFPLSRLLVEVQDGMIRPAFHSLLALKIDDSHGRDLIHLLRSCDFPAVQSMEITLPEDDDEPSDSVEFSDDDIPTFPNVKFISAKGLLYGAYAQLFHAEYHTLEKITLFAKSMQRCVSQAGNETISQIFDSLHFNNYRALKELQIASVNEWPWEDHELKNNAWQRRTRELSSTYGFKITDAFGTPWRPRILRHTKEKTIYG